jgi:REP element-mobilizing transposase RayT
MTIAGRQRGWLNHPFHDDFRALLGTSALQYNIAIPAYCLMPDHLHLLVAGIVADTDQLLWAKAFRRTLNQKLAPFRLQKQAYDHVLRPDKSSPDAFAVLIHYLAENPVRAGLAGCAQGWAYTGACVIGQPDLDPRKPDFCERWWRLWNAAGP